MRYAAIVAALVMLLMPGTARAQALCQPATVGLEDMAGVYESWESQIRVTVHACGGLHVLWSNPAGTHEAIYSAKERVSSGGFLATVSLPDPYVRSLDGRTTLAMVPDEPGFVTIVTMGPFGDDLRSYRLAQVAR